MWEELGTGVANSEQADPEHQRCSERVYLLLLLPLTLHFEPYLQKHCVTTCFPSKPNSCFYLLRYMCQRKTLLSQFSPTLILVLAINY